MAENQELVSYVVDRPYDRPLNHWSVATVDQTASKIKETPDESDNDACQISLKLASDIIPQFDGRSIPVWEFTKICRDVWKAVKSNERQFLIRIIEQKILKEAKSYARRRRNTYDINELLESLEKAFTLLDTLDALQTCMSNIYQRTGESAFQYGNRVNELLDDILDALGRECGADIIYGIKRRALENACNCYITGLSSKIELQMRQKNPATLQAAIDLAIDEEEYYKNRSRVYRDDIRRDRRERGRDRRLDVRRTRDAPETVRVNKVEATRTADDKSSLYCHNCRRTGHKTRDCRYNGRQESSHPFKKRQGYYDQKYSNKRCRDDHYNHQAQPQNNPDNLNSRNAPQTSALRGIAIVDNNFPIEQNGIIGMSFLTKQQALLSFKEKLPSSLILENEEIPFCKHPSFDLPPRTRKSIKIPVKNYNLEEGYIKRIDCGPGIFVGEAVVKPKDGHIKIFAINCTHHPVNLTIPPVELEDFEVLPPLARSARLGNPDNSPVTNFDVDIEYEAIISTCFSASEELVQENSKRNNNDAVDCISDLNNLPVRFVGVPVQ
ncbi:hypothetical protein KQX54_001127 [Cotesia glomerata]|uniref:CCHC-type domain-containing protein n=1 Tax=Cotesia glomerata TaxID=32391 RepID=A0AAV7IM18_COTGL|nr:hypothetical protein KQX54_001127 [Cotesia glomerata]